MTHPERAGSPRITVEKLLQLKRAERPAPEFWAQFERELRTKQLAAIVEKRPWWIALGMPTLGRRFRRLQAPIAGAALLTVGFAVLSQQGLVPKLRSTAEAHSADIASPTVVPAIEVLTDGFVARPGVIEAGPMSGAGDLMVARLENEPRVEAAVAPSAQIAASRAPTAEQASLMEMIPWAAAVRPEAKASMQQAPNDYTELSRVHFASAIWLGNGFDFDGRVDVEPVILTKRITVASAKPVPAPVIPSLSSREVRRNRILSNLNVADAGAETDRARAGLGREMLVSALDDSGLYDSVRRLGMGGDRLTLKF